MSKIFSTNEVSPVQLAATAKGLTEANIPMFVWGPPAIGKSPQLCSKLLTRVRGYSSIGAHYCSTLST